MTRAQLPMSTIEAAIGVLLVFGVTMGFALGVPGPDGTSTQLDAYAHDAAVLLADESPRHGEQTRLAEVLASEDRFDREAEDLADRVDRILTDDLMFAVETPHGRIGYSPPANAPVGAATVSTVNGDATIRVWYV